MAAATPKIPIALTGVSSTMLTTLASRAEDNSRPAAHRFLNDTYAKPTLDRLEYIPERDGRNRSFNEMVLLRSRHLDTWTREFLAEHPGGATVLHLACGLDSRALRVPWGEGVRWVDVDVPEVVELREKVVPSPEGKGEYSLVGADVTTTSWLEEIPADRPTLAVMEGLVMYLAPEQVEGLVRRICDRFGEKGGQIIADVVGTQFLQMQKWNTPIVKTGAVMRFAVDDAAEVARMHEKLRVRDQVRMWERPGRELCSWYARWSMWVFSWVPAVNTVGIDARLDF